MGTKEQLSIKIRTMRKSRKMTQEDLARAIDQSPSSITMYETGRRQPDFETLEALADVFNVPLVALLSDEEDTMDGTVQNHVDPKNDDIRVLVKQLNKLSPAQLQQAKDVFRAMFAITNPELFEGGEDNDST